MSDSESIEKHLLQTLVPVNALTNDHLKTLLRDQSIETVCKGQVLFEHGDYDNLNVYLLSGNVQLVECDRSLGYGATQLVSASDPSARFPLVHHQPRRCTAIANSDCSIIRFNSKQLDSMLAWDQASQYIILDISSHRELDEDADWMLTLLKSNLFYKVPPINIRQILDKFESIYMSSGETVLRQGEVGDGCYIIKEGVVGVYQAPDEKSPSEIVAELGLGRCFGEDALVNDAARNATIIMHSNGVLKKLNKRDFFLLLKQVDVEGVSLEQARQISDGTVQWLDVRTQDEYENGHYDGALHMPLNLLKLKSRMLDKNKQYIIYCNSGRRSCASAHLLSEDGFNACYLLGGIDDYSANDQAFFAAGISEVFLPRDEAANRLGL